MKIRNKTILSILGIVTILVFLTVIQVKATTPDPPRYFTTWDLENNTILLTWKSPSNILAEKYDIDWRYSTGDSWSNLVEQNQVGGIDVGQSYPVYNLEAYHTYYFRIRAYADATWGGWAYTSGWCSE
ncbi:MAG: fibronectin type III domain-containing protein [Asgard group archaeon]|nr:fibronectin type III domain-containing protein [Asgard group archaeon]